MPINDILEQPAEGSINAAYRPVVISITATKTNGDPVPPIVYCDIYFNDVYYKSLARTQYNLIDANVSRWVFDIQDAAQEFLQWYLSANGGSEVELADSITVEAFCRFRSSGIDADGYTVTEDTAPVQGSWGVAPTAGTGTESTTFTIVMASLQHDDSQDLAAHLNSYKTGSWGGTTYPLTHRPPVYRLCEEDSDFFPILSEEAPGDIEIHYTNNDGSTGTSSGSVDTGGGGGSGIDEDEPGCQGVGGGIPAFPNGRSGVAYFYSFGLTGTAPFTIDSFTGPAWMSANIVGNAIQFTGTPTLEDVDTGVAVEFSISNCSGDAARDFDDTFDILTSENFRLSSSFGLSLSTAGTDGTGAPALGPTGLNTSLRTHHTGVDGSVAIRVMGSPSLTTCLVATVNGTLVDCVATPIGGTPGTIYHLTIDGATEDDIVAFAVSSGTCPP